MTPHERRKPSELWTGIARGFDTSGERLIMILITMRAMIEEDGLARTNSTLLSMESGLSKPYIRRVIKKAIESRFIRFCGREESDGWMEIYEPNLVDERQPEPAPETPEPVSNPVVTGPMVYCTPAGMVSTSDVFPTVDADFQFLMKIE